VKKAKAPKEQKASAATSALGAPLRARGRGGMKWHKVFIEMLRRAPNVRLACEAAAIGRRTAYTHRERYRAFKQAWDTAIEDSVDLLEAAAFQRATQGTEEPVFMRDADNKPIQVGTIRRYSDRMAEILLKRFRPEKYRERVDSQVSGPGGKPIEIEQKVNAPIDFNELRQVAGEMFGFPQGNGHGQPVHSAPANGETGSVPESDRP